MEKAKRQSNGKSFVKGAAILGIAGLIVKLIGAVYRIPLNNIIGVEGMSFYEIVYPYYSWLLVISSSGLPTAISKLVSEKVTLGDYRGARRIFKIAFYLLVGIGLFTTALMFGFADALANFSGLPGAALSFRALAPALFFVSIMCAYRGYLQGMQYMTGTAVSQVIEQVIKLIVGFTLASSLLPKGPEYAAMGALIGVSASELVALIAIYFIYRAKKRNFDRRLNSSIRFKTEPASKTLRSLLTLAIPITIGASIMPLTGIADSAMIMNIMTDTGFTQSVAQSAYSILRSNVTTLINMPAVLTVALAMSLVPAIAARMTEGDKRGMIAASRTGMKLSLIIGAPCTVGLFVLAKPIIALLFTALDESQLVLAEDLMHTASIGVLFLSVVQALTGVIQGLGRPMVPVVNLFFGGVLKVVTMVALMNNPAINIQGAAVSTVVCYAAAAILDCIYLLRKTGMTVNFYDVFLKPILASLIMGVAAHFSYKLILSTGHENLATLAAIFIAVAVYGVLVIVLKMFSKSDLELIPGGNKLAKLIYR